MLACRHTGCALPIKHHAEAVRPCRISASPDPVAVWHRPPSALGQAGTLAPCRHHAVLHVPPAAAVNHLVSPLQVHLDKVGTAPGEGLADDINPDSVESLAYETEGYSGAALANLVNLALLQAQYDGRDKISLGDLESVRPPPLTEHCQGLGRVCCILWQAPAAIVLLLCSPWSCVPRVPDLFSPGKPRPFMFLRSPPVGMHYSSAGPAVLRPAGASEHLLGGRCCSGASGRSVA